VLRGPEKRGAEFETPKTSSGEGNGKGVSPSQPTRGSGELRKLPQPGPGRSPGRKRILVHFELEKTNLVMTNLVSLSFYSPYFESTLQG